MKSVMTHQFGQAPGADIPRSSFNRSFGHKTTINVDSIYPIFWDEALPGDTFNVTPYVFARLNTPLFPLMDNMYMDIHFFSVPIRQLWANFRKFMGEQVDPGDSIDYTIPQIVAPATTGWAEGTLMDYLGIPPGVPDISVSALPVRAYRHIMNEWYRDQNLTNSWTMNTTDGPDASALGDNLFTRGKRHDYFTSCLPWLQKGDAVDIPLGTTAPVLGIGAGVGTTFAAGPLTAYESDGNTRTYNSLNVTDTAPAFMVEESSTAGYPNIHADLTNATAATINQLRQAFQIQKLLERDARTGTRYAEIVKSHFGVDFFDVTYRPEFLGGTSSPININPVPQTAPTTGTENKGSLAAFGTVKIEGQGGFTKSFTEHCIVMGLCSVRADLTYQQGAERAWWRQTRYDYYWPALAHIGEQAVYTRELYVQDPTTDTGSTGTPDNDKVFGYQERWAEYRYKNSLITGTMRSSATTPLDAWHLSEEFSALPELNNTFIGSSTPIDRVVAVTTEPDFTVDTYFNCQCARPMPLYSVPGLIDHF